LKAKVGQKLLDVTFNKDKVSDEKLAVGMTKKDGKSFFDEIDRENEMSLGQVFINSDEFRRTLSRVVEETLVHFQHDFYKYFHSMFKSTKKDALLCFGSG